MDFNTDKCKFMILNGRRKNIYITLHHKILEVVIIYKYVGITLSNTRLTSLITKHVSHVIEKAEKCVNWIRHFGFTSDGLRPQTSIEMYKILARHILEYAAQVLNYRHHYLSKVERLNPLQPQPDMVQILRNFRIKF